MLKSKQYRFVFLILFISLAFRLFTWDYIARKDSGRFLLPDSLTYVIPAISILKTGSFAITYHDKMIAETIRTPGYPIFLAALILFIGESTTLISFCQIFLGLLMIYLVYWIGKRWWNPEVGIFAAILMSLDILSLSTSFQILTETLSALVVALMFAAGLSIFDKPEQKFRYVLLGILFGYAALIRPISYYQIVPVTVIFLTWGLFKKWSSKDLILRLFLLVLPCLFIIGGWRVRNQILTNNSDFSQIEGVNMLYYRGADIIARRDHITLEEAQKSLGIAEGPWFKAQIDPAAKLGRTWKKQGLELIVNHPRLFLQSWLAGFENLMLGPGGENLVRVLTGNEYTIGPYDLSQFTVNEYIQEWFIKNPLRFAIAVVAFIYLGIIYLGILAWFMIGIYKRTLSIRDVYGWSLILYFIVLSAGPEAYYRFRVPFMPLLVIYSAVGWREIIALMRKSRLSSFAWAKG